jgi:hypothetical protein
MTAIIFGVCALIFIARGAVSQMERETGGGTGAVLIGIADIQRSVPLALGFALGFWWVWRRSRRRTS